jgi:uncharacterized repeat protein (TIGR03803 family)
MSCVSRPAGAQVTTQHSFTNTPDGAHPLRLAPANGLLFGVTTGGGTNGNGSIFTFNTNGSTYLTIFGFPGAFNVSIAPNNLLVSGNIIYGTAQSGGTNGVGLVYAVGTSGAGFVPLYNFGGNTNDGQYPAGALVLSGGALYGTTVFGGTNGSGTVFKISTNGSGYSILHSFADSPDGAEPESELVSDGSNLYGTTSAGGTNGNGTVFALHTNGTGFTILCSFTNSPEPTIPYGGLVLSNGILYGTGSAGGTNNNGAIFAMNTNGTGFKNLYSFSASAGNTDGESPEATLTLSGGALYGTAISGGGGGGTIFMINTDGTGFSAISNFTNSSASGAEPFGGVIWFGNALWGTTYNNGTGGFGTLFDLPLLAPAITQQPQNDTVTNGNTATFASVASGTSPLFYQWYFNTNTPVAGGTGPILTLSPATTNSAGYYTVVVTNQYGSATSAPAELTVIGPVSAPVITQQPQNDTVTNGDAATFTSVASGTSPLFYQWYFNTNTPISGGTGPSLTLSTATTNSAGYYAVVVTNLAGGVTSAPAKLTVIVPLSLPVITQQPLSITVTNGYGAAFTNVASGAGPLFYQWYFNTNTPLVGGTNAILVISFVATNQAGFYTVAVSDSAGSVTSSPARLAVISTKPIIFGEPQPVSATNGAAVSFSVVAAGQALLKYQWYTNSVTAADAVRGGTNSTLAFTATNTLAQNYLVVVTNTLGKATSSPALLTVVTRPVITLNPVSVAVANGDPVSLSSAATGPGILSYQWLFHTNSLVAGATNTSLAFTNAYSTLAGYYAMRVTNNYGATTSSYALLTVRTQLNFLSFNFSSASGSASFALANAVGSTNRLWASSNLARAWFPIATNVLATNGLWFYTDPNTARTNAVRLYRFSTP